MIARAAAAALLGLIAAACAPQQGPVYVVTPQAMQRPWPEALPHLDRRGEVLTAFDPQRSVFTLALGGALVDYRQGVARGFSDAFAADFNAVAADPDQPYSALLRAADGSRVQLLQGQSDDAAPPARLDASAAAVIPVPRDPARIDAFAATAKAQGRRPVWALLPVHATPNTRLPNPAEAQALAFAAILHGASGLIWQGEDNYAARNAGMIGISPAPRLDYGIRTEAASPRIATPEEAAASKRLWDAVAQLNRRIARLQSALLQPEASMAYDVAVAAGEPGHRGPTVPVRTLLRSWEGGLLLIAVNIDSIHRGFRVQFPRPLRSIARGPGDEGLGALDIDPTGTLLRDRIEAHGLRLYRLIPDTADSLKP